MYPLSSVYLIFLCILRNIYSENVEINKVDIFVSSWKKSRLVNTVGEGIFVSEDFKKA
jgi:hypothetical protein